MSEYVKLLLALKTSISSEINRVTLGDEPRLPLDALQDMMDMLQEEL